MEIVNGILNRIYAVFFCFCFFAICYTVIVPSIVYDFADLIYEKYLDEENDRTIDQALIGKTNHISFGSISFYAFCLFLCHRILMILLNYY